MKKILGIIFYIIAILLLVYFLGLVIWPPTSCANCIYIMAPEPIAWYSIFPGSLIFLGGSITSVLIARYLQK